MSKWFYLNENKFQCSTCMSIITHMRAPKKCPNCDSEMENAFNILFPPNNWTPKKRKDKGTKQ